MRGNDAYLIWSVLSPRLLMITRASEQARSSEQPANIAAADYIQGRVESGTLWAHVPTSRRSH